MKTEIWNAIAAANYLGIHPNSLRAYVSRGTAPAPLKGRKPYQWHAQTIIDWDATRVTVLSSEATILRSYRRATARQHALLDAAFEAGLERGRHLDQLLQDGLSLRDVESLAGISTQAIQALIRRSRNI